MFENSIKTNQKNLIYLLYIIFTFYIVAPYFLSFYNNFFLENVLTNFPVESHEIMREYVITVISDTNFSFLFFLNSFLFLLIFFLLYISLFSLKIKFLIYSNLIVVKNTHLIMQIVICICIFIFLRDFIEIFYFFLEKGISTNHRSNVLQIIMNHKQTHMVIGSIFSIFLLKHNKKYIPLFFLVAVFCFEILTLSRFYIFLCCLCFFIFFKRKFLYALIPLTLFFITYRFFNNLDFSNFLYNFLWEPISLWCTEIINLNNFFNESNKEDFYSKIFFDNFFVNFIFFDTDNTYNPFLNSTFKQFGSYANFGLIYTLAYPIQTLFLLISIFFLKKIIDLFANYDDLFLIVYTFTIFKILRGSSIYGLSFILKFEILLLMMIFLSLIFVKLNFFKSSS